MRDYRDLFPPGYEWRGECVRVAVLYGLAFLNSLFFFRTLREEYNGLFYYDGSSGERILRPGAKMMPYGEVLGWSLIGFVLLMVFALTIMVMHYLYYYQGSRSILLVRRLPRRSFLWITCVAGPALFIAVSALTYGFLYLLYYGIYILVTPVECLP